MFGIKKWRKYKHEKISKKIISDLRYYAAKNSFFDINVENVAKAEEYLEAVHPYKETSCYSVQENKIEYLHDLHVVVPVFNGEKYIKQCIESILKLLEFGCDFLLTVVNDGSLDSTADILNNYMSNEHVEIIYQNNEGLSGARNKGLKHIKGRYVLFVDADDMIDAETVNKLLVYSLKHNIDISLGTFALTDEYDKIFKNSGRLKNYGEFDLSKQEIDGYTWGKLIKAEFFRNLVFPSGLWFEDTIMSVILYKLAKSCYALNTISYYYRQHGESIMARCKYDLRAIDDWYVLKQSFMDRHYFGITVNKSDFINMISNCFCSCIRVRALSYEIKKSLFICVCDFYIKYLSQYCVDTRSIKKLGGGYNFIDFCNQYKQETLENF